MKQIAAGKFKEQCLALLETVDDDGIVITKRGRPVAKLIPIRAESASLIGSLKSKLRIKGDILSTGSGDQRLDGGADLSPTRLARPPPRRAADHVR